MFFKIEIQSDNAMEVAKLFNTLTVLQQNQIAANSTPAGVTGGVTAGPSAAKSAQADDAKESAAPAKRSRAKAPEAATAAAPVPAAAGEEAITRDEALVFLRAIAEAKKISGPDLINYLKKNFGVPKFSDIKADRYVELKNLATETASEDPMA